MKELSLRRKHAGTCAGSNVHGSEGKRRRRLLTESSVRLVQGPQEWRDWANLLPELVDDISGRLLAFDVAEYRRFRAVCKPWRDLTADPHATPLNSRFRPRNWAVLTITPDGSSKVRRHLLNLSTAASLGVDLPPLSTHCHLCAADGLLVLYHRITSVICLLDPLTNAVTEFPSITSIVESVGRPLLEFDSNSLRSVVPRTVNGAAFDDSTTPPSLVLCLRGGVCSIVVAKPGDAHWTLVHEGDASYPTYNRIDKVLSYSIRTDRILFYSLLSMKGRCYVSSPEGSVYMINLRPRPRLVEVVNQRSLAKPKTIADKSIISFLFHDNGGDWKRMMMVRYWQGMQHFAGLQQEGYHRRKDLFRVRSTTSRLELLEVDLTERSLVPVPSLGRNAVFLGLTHCLLVSTETFPSIAADAMFLGCLHQRRHGFGVYHINKKVKNRRTGSPHKFAHDEHRGLVPAAQPCNLDQYLVCYVDHVHGYRGACINHIEYYHY